MKYKTYSYSKYSKYSYTKRQNNYVLLSDSEIEKAITELAAKIVDGSRGGTITKLKDAVGELTGREFPEDNNINYFGY